MLGSAGEKGSEKNEEKKAKKNWRPKLEGRNKT